MSATLSEIHALLISIKAELPGLIQRSQIVPKQIIIANGLSDLSERLGLIQAGEFRAGNSIEPGLGFSGVRWGYPAFTYNNEEWHVAGVNDDTLQFGLNAANGKAYFAGGSAILDVSGMILEAQNNQSYFILWKSDDDLTTVGKIGAFYVSTDAGIEVVGQTKSGYTPVAHLMTADADNAFLTGIEVRGNGEIQVDLRTATIDTIGDQKVRIMTNVNSTNQSNTVLYLESNSKGTAAVGFGTGIAFLAENASGTMKTIGYIAVIYTDATNGSEDTKVVAGRLAAGSSVEKILAP